MPRLTLQADGESERAWVMLDGQRLVCLRDGDREGLIGGFIRYLEKS